VRASARISVRGDYSDFLQARRWDSKQGFCRSRVVTHTAELTSAQAGSLLVTLLL